MVFSSLTFIFLVLPIFLLIYFALPNRAWRNIVLLIASLFFYAWGEPVYVLLMLASIVINYFFAFLIDKGRYEKNPQGRNSMFLLILLINIGVLAVFKYSGFFISNVNSVFGLNMTIPNISLPIGISFFTFQILSYIIDVYTGRVEAQRNLLYLGAYIAAFPQLIAGPIVRYETIALEMVNRKEDVTEFAQGIRRFIIGLSKKVLIANNVAVVADAILLRSPQEYGMLGAWVGIIAYSLQIYFDFSGYSDMAIGLGRMLGFHYLENFNFPYLARSITDFWRRWHISLSSFFRDYVYIPLGGNRGGNFKFARNILIVWGLTGLWHGASWNFVLWGLYYGVLLIVEKFFIGEFLYKLPRVFGHIYTLLIVIIGWAIFRMENLELLKGLLGALFGAYGSGSVEFFKMISIYQMRYIIAGILGIIWSVPLFKVFETVLEKNAYYQLLTNVLLLILFIISIMSIASGSFNPFIYFRF